MWPVTEEFRAAIRQSHQAVTRVDLYIEGSKLRTIYPNDGSVSCDSRRTVRRTLSMTVADDDGTLTPAQGAQTGLLTPFGTELHVFRGIAYPDGTEELIPVGVFVVTQVSVAEEESGRVLTVNGSDRSIRISRNKFLNTYRIASGGTLEAGLTQLLRDRWADVQTAFPATGITLPNVVIEAQKGGDPWAGAVSIAEAFGYDMAFDADGIVRLRPIPDPLDDEPIETYEDGSEAVLTSLTRSFDSARAFNGVVVASQGSSTTPFRAIAWDENPNSVTYRYGPFGEVPFFYDSSLITTPEQAAITAEALLRKSIGQSESVEWAQIVNPAHDVLDLIRIKRQERDLDFVLLIDRLDIPLSPTGIMSAVARSQEIENG